MRRNFVKTSIAACSLALGLSVAAQASEHEQRQQDQQHDQAMQDDLPNTIVIKVIESHDGKGTEAKLYCLNTEQKITDETTAAAANQAIVEEDGVLLSDQLGSAAELPREVSQIFAEYDAENVDQSALVDDFFVRRPNSWRYYRPVGPNRGWFGYGHYPNRYGYRVGYSPYYGYYWNNRVYPYIPSAFSYRTSPYAYYYYHHPRL